MIPSFFKKWKIVLLCPFMLTSNLFSQQINFNISSNDKILNFSDNIVTLKYEIINNTSESFTDITFASTIDNWKSKELIRQIDYDLRALDPNENETLDAGESWVFSVDEIVNSKMAEVFIAKAGLIASKQNGQKVFLSDAQMLYAFGVNMDVELDDCIFFNQINEVSLRSRLLIDEDAAKDPGTTIIMVGGIPIEIQLPKTRWEARDEVLHVDLINNNEPLDPFNPPADLTVSILCDQDNVDGGRNSNQVLDECEPVNTVRFPCDDLGENDELCEFPDWEFCVSLFIPDEPDIPDSMIVKDINGVPVVPAQIKVTASDQFNIWYCEESPPGSDNYTDFEQINTDGSSGNVDSESTLLKEAIVIPVILKTFSAKFENDKAVILWETESEINTSHFEIQKSTNGISFEKIGTVEAKGFSNSEQTYRFEDTQQVNSKSYYRLKLIDYDGLTEYSNIVVLDFERDSSKKFKISPNPNGGDFKLISNQNIERFSIEIIDVKGALLHVEEVHALDEINVSDFAKGVYVVKILGMNGQFLDSELLILK